MRNLIIGICLGVSITAAGAFARDFERDMRMETAIGLDNLERERNKQEWDRIYRDNNRRNPC